MLENIVPFLPNICNRGKVNATLMPNSRGKVKQVMYRTYYFVP